MLPPPKIFTIPPETPCIIHGIPLFPRHRPGKLTMIAENMSKIFARLSTRKTFIFSVSSMGSSSDKFLSLLCFLTTLGEVSDYRREIP